MLRAYFNKLLEWSVSTIKTHPAYVAFERGDAGTLSQGASYDAEGFTRKEAQAIRENDGDAIIPGGSADYVLARAIGVEPLTIEPPQWVRLIRVWDYLGGKQEWFQMPDGTIELHRDGVLVSAERHGIKIEQLSPDGVLYYEKAKARGLSVGWLPFDPLPGKAAEAEAARDRYIAFARAWGLEEPRRNRLVAALKLGHLMRYAPDVALGADGVPRLFYQVVFVNGKVTGRSPADPGADGVIERFGREDLLALCNEFANEIRLTEAERRDVARALAELDPGESAAPILTPASV